MAARKTFAPPSMTYTAVHQRLRAKYGSASTYLCEGCCGSAARHWARVHGTQGEEIFKDYVPMCASCHMKYDMTDEWREKNRSAFKGRRHSADSIRKMSEKLQGHVISAETRRKISEAQKGKPRTRRAAS
jgi:NUMOD3 motif